MIEERRPALGVQASRWCFIRKPGCKVGFQTISELPESDILKMSEECIIMVTIIGLMFQISWISNSLKICVAAY